MLRRWVVLGGGLLGDAVPQAPWDFLPEAAPAEASQKSPRRERRL